MSCQYNLLFVFLCGFAALSVSEETCGKDVLVGTSCIIKLKTKHKDTPFEIKWVHDGTIGYVLRWKNGAVRNISKGVSKEKDGSFKFSSVSLKDTGKYTFNIFNNEGTEIGKGEVEIKVYEKAPKPTVTLSCSETLGNATLSCDIGSRKDLTLSWYKDGKIIQNHKNPQVFLSSTQVRENKPYSCEANNPVSKDKSESITVSCPGSGLLLGFDFWVMVSILAGGGALLLLLISVLIICACKSSQQRTKRQREIQQQDYTNQELATDEEEMRLAELTLGQNGTSRSKQTARGQPAPPVPQEDSMPCSPSPETPPRSQTQTKAQIRARPPPPPQDEDEDDPPPLPKPRNKQHRNKSQEPYRPME